jgi:single-stranded DNA-binding protein
MVEGSLRNDSWEKDGVKHSTIKVRVNNFSKISRSSKSKVKTATSLGTENEEPVAF